MYVQLEDQKTWMRAEHWNRTSKLLMYVQLLGMKKYRELET
jgi:hypothetical protein